ncbi:hypothetical protein BJX99DRAFT_32306 [Aspergillus californicus]
MSALLLGLTSILLVAFPASAGYLQETSSLADCASNKFHYVASGDNCANIARRNSVPRASLTALNALRPDCGGLKIGQELCLPEPCLLYDVYSGTTCLDIAQANNININQVFEWNAYLNPQCTNLVPGEQVCVGKPGVLPGTTTVIVPRAVETTGYATATVAPPGPLPHGTTQKCGEFYQVQSGDFCELITDKFSIEPDLFQAINPSINPDCTNLVPGLFYCVFPTQDWNSTTTTTAGSTYLTAPAPTPSGTTNHCYEWYVVRSGDSCLRISSEYGITVDDMRLWNPSLRDDCSNLRPGHAYCIHGDPLTTSVSWVAAEPTVDA